MLTCGMPDVPKATKVRMMAVMTICSVDSGLSSLSQVSDRQHTSTSSSLINFLNCVDLLYTDLGLQIKIFGSFAASTRRFDLVILLRHLCLCWPRSPASSSSSPTSWCWIADITGLSLAGFPAEPSENPPGPGQFHQPELCYFRY